MGIEGGSAPIQEVTAEKFETIFESEHLPVSWLGDENKAFVRIIKDGEEFVVSGEIENEEELGRNEVTKEQEFIMNTTGQVKEDVGAGELKWHAGEAPTSKVCASEEEAREYAKTFLEDREEWLSGKYN